jgi:hypothetical protein
MAFVVSGLADYVQNNREIILKDIVLGADSIQRMTIQPGVKKSADLNFLLVEPALQSGADCGWNASGNATFSKRTITTAAIKVNMAFCKKTLLGKWTEYVVRFGANNEEFPFEQYIIDGVREGIKKQMEKLVWQGDTSNSDLFDGLLKIINAASGTIKETIASGASAYDAIYQVFMAIPTEILDKDDLTINVSPLVFRAFCKELTDRNMFHYTADGSKTEVILPGTSCKVKMVKGLADSVGHKERKIVATFDKNLYYGCDMLDDAEEVKAWYSEDADEHRIRVDFNAGVQIAFPDLCVLGSMAADPVSPEAESNALNKIAAATAELADADHVYKTDEQN